MSVDVVHQGPVHIDALATDGSVNYGGGNIDIVGSGRYTFQQIVSFPKGVTATFFADMYRHLGPNRIRLFDHEEEAFSCTCS